MSQSRQLRRLQERQKVKNRQQGVSRDVSAKHHPKLLRPVLVCVLLCAVAMFALVKMQGGKSNAADASTADALPRIEDLIKMSDDQITDIGIARVNLACAQDLGQATETAKFLKALEQMTAAVWSTTTRNQHRFVENPAEYENSEIYYKVGMLATVVGQDFGARYNRDKIQAPNMTRSEDDHFFDNAADVFLTGLLSEARQGTCSSLPVLCVAVGRKLGYPLHLVSAKGHLFFRWDDGKQHMNFENTNKLSVYDDEHFKKWPFPITEAELKQGLFLQNLKPREELAVFLSIRGSVLKFQGRIEEAFQAFTQANQLHPHPGYQMALASINRPQKQLLPPSPTNQKFYETLGIDETELHLRRVIQESQARRQLNVNSTVPLPRDPTPFVPMVR